MWVVIDDSLLSIGDYVDGWGFEVLDCVQYNELRGLVDWY